MEATAYPAGAPGEGHVQILMRSTRLNPRSTAGTAPEPLVIARLLLRIGGAGTGVPVLSTTELTIVTVFVVAKAVTLVVAVAIIVVDVLIRLIEGDQDNQSFSTSTEVKQRKK